jgi:hypothetical protein
MSTPPNVANAPAPENENENVMPVANTRPRLLRSNAANAAYSTHRAAEVQRARNDQIGGKKRKSSKHGRKHKSRKSRKTRKH